jgi:hypothetical protein
MCKLCKKTSGDVRRKEEGWFCRSCTLSVPVVDDGDADKDRSAVPGREA